MKKSTEVLSENNWYLRAYIDKDGHFNTKKIYKNGKEEAEERKLERKLEKELSSKGI